MSSNDVVELTEWVKKGHMENYVSILKHCNGRFVKNPSHTNDEIFVHVTVPSENYRKFSNSVMLLKTPIREVDRRTWYKRIYNRFVHFCKNIFN